jgi:hypothetical protein
MLTVSNLVDTVTTGGGVGTVDEVRDAVWSDTNFASHGANTAGSKLIYEEAGQVIEKDLPFRDLQFPEGSYQAKIVNQLLGTEKKVEFNIEENKKHFLE